jgi:hypothetical protein
MNTIRYKYITIRYALWTGEYDTIMIHYVLKTYLIVFGQPYSASSPKYQWLYAHGVNVRKVYENHCKR